MHFSGREKHFREWVIPSVYHGGGHTAEGERWRTRVRQQPKTPPYRWEETEKTTLQVGEVGGRSDKRAEALVSGETDSAPSLRRRLTKLIKRVKGNRPSDHAPRCEILPSPAVRRGLTLKVPDSIKYSYLKIRSTANLQFYALNRSSAEGRRRGDGVGGEKRNATFPRLQSNSHCATTHDGVPRHSSLRGQALVPVGWWGGAPAIIHWSRSI